jgi:hypothetical protein
MFPKDEPQRYAASPAADAEAAAELASELSGG